MLTGDGGNIAVQVGEQGPMVINSGAGAITDKIVAAIKKLSDKPIQFIVNTGFQPDVTGGNVKLRAAGFDPSVQGSFFSGQFVDAGKGATIIGHQNVQNHLMALKTESRRVAQRHVRGGAPAQVPQRRSDRNLPYAERRDRCRQHRALPAR